MSKNKVKGILKPIMKLPSSFGVEVAYCGLDDPLGLLEKDDKLNVYQAGEIQAVWGIYYGVDLFYVYKVDDIYFFKCKSEYGKYFAVFKGNPKDCAGTIKNMDKIISMLK